jgi:hypothetical protein
MDKAAGQRHGLRQKALVVLAQIQGLVDNPPPLTSAADLEAHERHLVALTDELTSIGVAVSVQQSLMSESLQRAAQELVHGQKRYKSDGLRGCMLTFSRGGPQMITSVYYRRKATGASARGKGLWPGLLLLGFFEHRSPAANAMLAIWACAVSSLKEARDLLQRQGVPLDVKTLRNLVYRFGQRARLALSTVPFTLPQNAPPGRCIAVSTDGGRIRIRTDKRGPPTAKGRRRYHAQWREPRLLHICCYRPDGTPDKEFCPIIDGTLDGPDAVFLLLRHYLRAFGLRDTDKILLIADAAPWIWIRFDALIAEGALYPARVFQLIDFYHAVQHLRAFSDACTHWKPRVRSRWFTQARALLKKGDAKTIIERMDKTILQRRRRSKALNEHANYFRKNAHRFSYAWARRCRLPIGSGPMESAVRRVINLRLKGPGIFWHEESANAILLLRSFYKANRWNQLQNAALSPTLDLLQ